MKLETRAALITLYSDPIRAYHTTEHVNACLRQLDALHQKMNFAPWVLDCLTNAIWFHDAVYDPLAAPGRNEHESHLLWLNTENNRDDDDAVLVSCLIKATAKHSPDLPDSEIRQILADYGKNWANLPHVYRGLIENLHYIAPYFLDIDLSILGASHSDYVRYSEQIGKEYQTVPTFFYKTGREKVLHSFLAKEKIFLTKEMSFLEARARENLQWEIDLLNTDYQ